MTAPMVAAGSGLVVVLSIEIARTHYESHFAASIESTVKCYPVHGSLQGETNLRRAQEVRRREAESPVAQLPDSWLWIPIVRVLPLSGKKVQLRKENERNEILIYSLIMSKAQQAVHIEQER